MPTYRVTLVPTGAPDEYDLTRPASMGARLRILSGTEAELAGTLADRELGIASDTGKLLLRQGAALRKWVPE